MMMNRSDKTKRQWMHALFGLFVVRNCRSLCVTWEEWEVFACQEHQERVPSSDMNNSRRTKVEVVDSFPRVQFFSSWKPAVVAVHSEKFHHFVGLEHCWALSCMHMRKQSQDNIVNACFKVDNVVKSNDAILMKNMCSLYWFKCRCKKSLFHSTITWHCRNC